LEVLEQLPAPMRDAFDKQDIAALHQAVASMKASDARKWMKMCVDSGLWVPSHADEFAALEREDEADDEEEEGKSEPPSTVE
jgi:cell division cycle protein 37